MALVARRRQVVEMLTAESNRHGRAVGSINRAIAAHVRWLRKQLAELDAALEQAIRNSPLWSEKARLLRGVPAVGSVTVLTLLAHLPSSAHSAGERSRLWLEWLHSITTAGSSGHTRDLGRVAPRSARCSTCAR